MPVASLERGAGEEGACVKAERQAKREPPVFCFWIEDGHVRVAGNDLPKSALMLLRCAAALLGSLVERELPGDEDERADLAEEYALNALRTPPLFVGGKSDRNPDAVVAIERARIDIQLAKLLTIEEHKRIAATAVAMCASLNRPGQAAVFLDPGECARMLWILVSVGAHADAPIPWTDPFAEEKQ